MLTLVKDSRNTHGMIPAMEQRSLCVLTAIISLAACDSASNDSGSSTGKLALSGILVSGSAVEGVRAGVRAGQQGGVRAGQTGGVRASDARSADPPAAGQPLPNYALYCVTFEDTPEAGKGTADTSGRFDLDIRAVGAPFGCFVLDPNGSRVADLIFGRGDSNPLTAATQLDASTDLGTVIVDSATYTAFADLSGVQVVESTVSSEATSDPNHDSTGTWLVTECKYFDGSTLKNCDLARRMFVGNKFYFNQLRGRDLATGDRRYFIGAWISEDAFAKCGRTEGASPDFQEGMGMALDPAHASSTQPFTFLPEPPETGNWDEIVGPCTGSNLSGQSAVCKDLPGAAEAAACHAGCFQAYVAMPPDACIEDRSYDYVYLNRHLADPEGKTFNLIATAEAEGFIIPRGTPIARRSFLEVSFSTPYAMSGADFYAFTEGIPDTETQVIRSCTSTMTMSASAVLDPASGVATEDAVFNFGLAIESPDFAWCASHTEKLAFGGFYGTEHLRLKRKKA